MEIPFRYADLAITWLLMGLVIIIKTKIRISLMENTLNPHLNIKAIKIVIAATVSILLLVRSLEYILENLNIPIIPKIMYTHDIKSNILYIIFAFLPLISA